MPSANGLQAPPVTLRPAGSDDTPFLHQLYATTRELEMSLVDWDTEQKQTFLTQQANAQLATYRQNYPTASHNIILIGNEPIGRIYINQSDAEIRLLDITLLPDHRNKGIGTYFIEKLKADGRANNLPVRFYVWQYNVNAIRFYQRHGFVQNGGIQVYNLMEWYPPTDTI